MFSSATLFSIGIRQETFILFLFTGNVEIGIQFPIWNDNEKGDVGEF